ncbi:MAG TPA: RNA methyltransferase [Ktedonobacteraceae bacterium]|nr:RNA methyltransferase [Ktedonobacteraceae bacterium]
MVRITSSANPRIKRARELHASAGRKKYGLFLMEGPRLLETLLDIGGEEMLPEEVFYQPELLGRTEKGRALLGRLLRTPALARRLVEVSERVIEALGDAQTSQGVVSVLPLTLFAPARLRANRPAAFRPALLILDDIADPGNMGTILRTALAANVDAVLLIPNCVDPFNPKVVRAAAGAHVALPIEVDMSWPAIAERVARHCPEGPRVLLAEAGSSHIYYEQDLTRPFALITGNEAHGPSPQARALATLTISIPLANGVESLNAAMATGIILYEGVRQMKITGQV